MTAVSAVGRVVSVLEDAEYSVVPVPFVVGGIPFTFSALVVGMGRAIDIIAVEDLAVEQESRLRQKIDALARVLDVLESTRSLTVVTVGPSLGSEAASAIGRVARVLAVEPGSPPEDALAVLLPLTLPAAADLQAEPFEEVATWSAKASVSLEPIVTAAEKGADAVTRALAKIVREAVSSPEHRGGEQ
jgi:hypothetical protein